VVLSPETYYTDTYALRDDLERVGEFLLWLDYQPVWDAKLGKPYWEKRHNRRTATEAEKYADIFPNLEWIYFGERAMCIEADNGGTGPRRPVSTSELDNGYSYFKSMFAHYPYHES
jgi:hypothetical protein